MQRMSPFSALSGGDVAFPKLLWDFLFVIVIILQYMVSSWFVVCS